MRSKKEKGFIEISFEKEKNYLIVKISDNGPGIKKYASKSGHNSMGISITSERLRLLNLHKTDGLSIKYNSAASGTTVIISVNQEVNKAIKHH